MTCKAPPSSEWVFEQKEMVLDSIERRESGVGVDGECSTDAEEEEEEDRENCVILVERIERDGCSVPDC